MGLDGRGMSCWRTAWDWTDVCQRLARSVIDSAPHEFGMAAPSPTHEERGLVPRGAEVLSVVMTGEIYLERSRGE